MQEPPTMFLKVVKNYKHRAFFYSCHVDIAEERIWRNNFKIENELFLIQQANQQRTSQNLKLK